MSFVHADDLYSFTCLQAFNLLGASHGVAGELMKEKKRATGGVKTHQTFLEVTLPSKGSVVDAGHMVAVKVFGTEEVMVYCFKYCMLYTSNLMTHQRGGGDTTAIGSIEILCCRCRLYSQQRSVRARSRADRTVPLHLGGN